MTTTVYNRCPHCGQHVEPTAAVIAAGAAHPSCAFRSFALTAGAGGALEADRMALALWEARRTLRTLRRPRHELEGARR